MFGEDPADSEVGGRLVTVVSVPCGFGVAPLGSAETAGCAAAVASVAVVLELLSVTVGLVEEVTCAGAEALGEASFGVWGGEAAAEAGE